jgi:hypothetical protein
MVIDSDLVPLPVSVLSDPMVFEQNVVSRLRRPTDFDHRHGFMDRAKRPFDKGLKVDALRWNGRINRVVNVYVNFEEFQETRIENRCSSILHKRESIAVVAIIASLAKTVPLLLGP